MTVLEALKALRRLWPVAVACSLVAGTLMWLITPVAINTERQVANFDAIATLLVVPRDGPVEGGGPNGQGGDGERVQASPAATASPTARPRGTATPSRSPSAAVTPSPTPTGVDNTLALNRIALLVTTGEVPHLAAQKLGYRGDPAVLAGRVRVNAANASSSVAISMTSKDSRPAVETVNAFAEAAVEYFAGPGQGIGVDVLLLEEATALPNETTEAYVAPPSKLGRTLAAAIVGLVLGVGLVLFVGRLDPRLQTRRQVARALALPVLAEIPRRRRVRSTDEIAVLDDPRGAEADGYRVLASAVLHARAEQGHASRGDSAYVIVVTPLAGGADETVVNLAASLGTNLKVLVMDGDLRTAGLADRLDVPELEGVSDYLADPDGGVLARFAHPSRVPGVQLVTAGTDTGRPVLVTSRLGQALEAAKGMADVVILKAPPLLAASEVFDLLPLADMVLVSVRSGRLEPAAATRAMELLHRFRQADTGVVLVGVEAHPFTRRAAKAVDQQAAKAVEQK